MDRSVAFRVIAVMNDIKVRLKSNDNSVNSLEILKLAYRQLESLQQVAKTSVSSNLHDLISPHVDRLNEMINIDSDSEADHVILLQNVKAEIDSFTPQLKMMEHKCSDGLYNTCSFLDEDKGAAAAAAVSSESSMIGVPDVYQRVKDRLMSRSVTSIIGMPGIGKTALANKIFHDPSVVEAFDHRVWVRLGKKYQAKHIPRRLLQEIDPAALQMLPEGDEEAVGEYLKACLKSKRYLIALDDVWDKFTMHHLHPYYDNSLIDWESRYDVVSCLRVGCNS